MLYTRQLPLVSLLTSLCNGEVKHLVSLLTSLCNGEVKHLVSLLTSLCNGEVKHLVSLLTSLCNGEVKHLFILCMRSTSATTCNANYPLPTILPAKPLPSSVRPAQPQASPLVTFRTTPHGSTHWPSKHSSE